MKFLLPLFLVVIAMPSRADMVLTENSQVSRILELLGQRFSNKEFRGHFAVNEIPSIAIYRVANNPGLGIGLMRNQPSEISVAPLFPQLLNEIQGVSTGELDQEEAQALVALTTPEPASYAMLGAAIGGLLWIRRRRT